jgi:para-nitrobenzyl esterase
VSVDVPMVISTALDERAYRMTQFRMSEDELLAFVRQSAGARAAEVVAMYRAEDGVA